MSRRLITTSYIRDNYYMADLRTIRNMVKNNCRYKYVNGRLLVVEEDIISFLESADYKKKVR